MNDVAVKSNKPFIFGACVGSYGLQFTIIPGQTPCLHCIIDHVSNQQLTCDIVSVISPIVQINTESSYFKMGEQSFTARMTQLRQKLFIIKSCNIIINFGYNIFRNTIASIVEHTLNTRL